MKNLNEYGQIRLDKEVEIKKELSLKILDRLGKLSNLRNSLSSESKNYPFKKWLKVSNGILFVGIKELESKLSLCDSFLSANPSDVNLSELDFNLYKVVDELEAEHYGDSLGNIQSGYQRLFDYIKHVGQISDTQKLEKKGFHQIDHFRDHYADSAIHTYAYTRNYPLSIVTFLHDVPELFTNPQKSSFQFSFLKRLLKQDKRLEPYSDEIIDHLEVLDQTSLLFRHIFDIDDIKAQSLIADKEETKDSQKQLKRQKELRKAVSKLHAWRYGCKEKPLLLIVELSDAISNIGNTPIIQDTGSAQGMDYVLPFIHQVKYVTESFFELNEDTPVIENPNIISIAESMKRGMDQTISFLANSDEIIATYDQFKQEALLIEDQYQNTLSGQGFLV